MTLTSGDMHDNKARTQSAAKIVPLSRRQTRMISGIAAFLIIYEVEKRRKRKRRWGVRPWAREVQKQAQGFADNLVMELCSTHAATFHNFFR